MNMPLLLIGTHVLCFIGGGLITFVIFCLCMAASRDDELREELEKELENRKRE